MPYYRNARMLIRHLITWRGEWSAELRDRIEIVLVDDGSPDDTAAEVLAQMWNGSPEGLPSIALYRVKEDRPWHQHGARNLGAQVAAAPDLLMTDMDHVVPPATLGEVLHCLPLGPGEVLTFGRVDAPRSLTWKAMDWPEFAPTCRADGSAKPHVNSFAVSRNHYWSVGGYDEAYCGIYGTDREFRDRLFGASAVVRHLGHAPLIRVAREVIPDASTRGVERKTEGRSAAKKAVAARKAAAGIVEPLTLDFEWERLR